MFSINNCEYFMCFSSNSGNPEILKKNHPLSICSSLFHLQNPRFHPFTFLVPVLRFHPATTWPHRKLRPSHRGAMRPEVYSPLHSKLKATLVHQLRASWFSDFRWLGRSSPPMDVSENKGAPKWMVKIMENPKTLLKWMIWGENPLFLETPIYNLPKFIATSKTASQ